MWKMDYIKVILIVILVRGDGRRNGESRLVGYSRGRQCLLAHKELKCLLVGTILLTGNFLFPFLSPPFRRQGLAVWSRLGRLILN